MEDRITTIAKLVAEFDGTLKSANNALDKIEKIRIEIRKELAERTQELNAIDGLHTYIHIKRSELAHEEKPLLVEELTMTTKQERVEAVLDAALKVVGDDIPIFNVEDIQRQLGRMRIGLGVSYPPAVIATILTADKRFKKTSTGLYEYISKEQIKQRGRETK